MIRFFRTIRQSLLAQDYQYRGSFSHVGTTSGKKGSQRVHALQSRRDDIWDAAPAGLDVE